MPVYRLRDLHPRSAKMRRRTVTGGWLKRAMDIAVSAPLLAVISPALAALAVAIMLTSRGSPFFLQRRIGLNGKPFLIIKLRTMTVRDDGARITQASRTDSRVTPIGRVLRRTSIDELPQLVNVLTGDMSLIGPRPHAVTHDREISAIAPDWRFRQFARPGITGLAQVNGARGELNSVDDITRRAEWDARYVARWSLWLDIKILLRTLVLPFRDKNAF